MGKAGKSRQATDQERLRISTLLSAYGSLLTQRQLALAQQFCTEGKNFSQIAREREVSRQAVHEAIRSVQHQLELFEMKLGLVENNAKFVLGDASALASKIEDLRQRVLSGEFGQECIQGVTTALSGILQSIATPPLPVPEI